MRRMVSVILAILCLCCLAVPAMAASGADKISSDSYIGSDGSCAVTTSVQIRLESSVEDLTFPIPGNATNITVNGVSPRTQRRGETRLIDLSAIIGGYAGSYSVTIQYTLPNVVSTEEEKVLVTVPLLSGFTYPVEAMEFSVTLPAAVESRPSFSSGYFQDSIESDLDFVVSNATVSGVLTTSLKDRETLTMTLEVPEDMFDRAVIRQYDNSFGIAAMIVCAVLALIFYLTAMRPGFNHPFSRPQAPEGINAGELGSYIHGAGIDLTMLVLSWGQMGYLMLQLDDNGRVLLHKRMDMGNERSAYENRCFRSLFGRRSIVDGTGYHYALLAKKMARKSPAAQNAFRSDSGNPRIFRALCAGVGLFGGVAMACSMVQDTAMRTALSILFGAIGAVSAWLVQDAGHNLLLKDQMSKLTALAGTGAMVILGLVSGQILIALIVILAALLAGGAAVLGGRRSEMGRQAMGEILGLRRYMQRADEAQLRQILKRNPDYYYDLAPYALALGVDKAFAKKFGKLKLPPCPYLTAGMTGRMTALEWSHLLRDAAAALNARRDRLPLEKFIAK